MTFIKSFLCGASRGQSSRSDGAAAKEHWIPVDADVEYGRDCDEYVLPANRPYVPGDERALSTSAQTALRHLFPSASAPLEALRQAKKFNSNWGLGVLTELVNVCENLEHFDFSTAQNAWAYAAFKVAESSPKLRDIKAYLRDDHDLQRFSNAFGTVLPNVRSLSIGSRSESAYSYVARTLDPKRVAELVRRMPRLRYLDVASHPFTDAEMISIVKSTQLKGLVIKSTRVKGSCLGHPALRGLQYLDISDLYAKGALAHVKRLKNLAYLAAGSSEWSFDSKIAKSYAKWCEARGVLLMGGFNPAATQLLVNQLWADAARSDGSIPVENLADLQNFRERIGGFLKYVGFPKARWHGGDSLQKAQNLVDYAQREISDINRVRGDNAIVSFKLRFAQVCTLSLTDLVGGTYNIEVPQDDLLRAQEVKPLSAALQQTTERNVRMSWTVPAR